MIKSLLLLVLLLPGCGYAVCSLATPPASFGSQTTFYLQSNVATTSSNTSVNCGSGLLSLLSNNYIAYAFTSATNQSGTRAAVKSSTAGDDSVPIQICIDSGCGTELLQGNSYRWNTAALLALGNSYNFTIPLYFRTLPGQVIAAGTYTTTLTLTISYNICTGLSVAGICTTGLESSNGTPQLLTVTLVATNDCTTITAPNVNFGSAPLAGSFSAIQQTISVVCSKGSAYSVGLSNGSNYSGTTRQMASGTNRLAYDIYKGTTLSARWGPAGSDRWSSSASSSIAADTVTRNFIYTARIVPTQATPPAGNYSDNVVVDVAF